MGRAQTRSPTPTQRSVSAPNPVPNQPRARAPPPAPINFEYSEGREQKQRQPSVRKAPPAPLDINNGNGNNGPKENRLSQDWVQISQQEISFTNKDNTPFLPEPAPMPQNPRLRKGSLPLPMAQMVPMKSNSPPPRPSLDHARSLPIAAGQPQRKARASLDNLRSKSPGPGAQPPRARQNSLSTPPSVVLETAAHEKSGGGIFNVFRSGRRSEDALRRSEDMLRRSEDMLRPSMDSIQPPVMSKKESKARAKEIQKSLGVANGSMPGTTMSLPLSEASESKDKERKSSGLSLKKSSGALKALFNRSKGKEREKEMANFPPMPSSDELSQYRNFTAPAAPVAEPRPSFTQKRAKTPEPKIAPEPEKPKRDNKLDKLDTAGHARTLYPSRVSAADKMRKLRPELVPVIPSEAAPQRDLPPLPSPSPVRPTADTAAPSLVVTEPINGLGSASSLASSSRSFGNSTLEPAFEPSSTLRSPSPRLDVAPTPPLDLDFDNSRWQTFLQMPNLDLGFDITFDKIGRSPTSPRLSPGGSNSSPSRSSPQRSFTLRASPSPRSSPRLSRSNSDRRRSQSFDGENRPSHDFFAGVSRFDGPDFSKAAFTTPPSNYSATLSGSRDTESSVETPDLSAEAAKLSRAVPIMSSEGLAQVTLSRASTPSESSSTNETHSPSPPRTPEEDHSAQVPEAPRMPKKATPKVLAAPERRALNPPNIPLPALPPLPPTVAALKPSTASSSAPIALAPPVQVPELPASTTRQASPQPFVEIKEVKPLNIKRAETKPLAVKSEAKFAEPKAAEAKPVEPVAPEVKPVEVKPAEGQVIRVKGPRENKPVLVNRSMLVEQDPAYDTLSIARELERMLYTFRAPAAIVSASDKSSLLRNDLLPLLSEIDHRPLREDIANKALREQCFAWIDQLNKELKVEQSANERGACLECLAAVLESSCLSERALAGDATHRKRFTDIMIQCMTFVMSKLGAKGVFHNTLLFSGRFLAFAFFRVPHVGEQLVTVLPPPRGALMRFTRSSLQGVTVP